MKNYDRPEDGMSVDPDDYDDDEDDIDLIEEGRCEHGLLLWEYCEDCEA